MKKFLALLLTVLMIGGMLPTAFAADAVANPKYVFTSDVFGVTSGSSTAHLQRIPTERSQQDSMSMLIR